MCPEDALEKAVWWLEHDTFVGIFPEGTRAPDHEIGQLQRGAFRLAQQTNEQIQPVVVVGTVLNKSHEHIDVGTFITDLEREMTNSQKVLFVASKSEREEIREERKEQAVYSREDTQKRPGQELGADFMMMGRYFARFDESPTRKLLIGDKYVKEYWGEGSNRARNWQRYDMGGNDSLKFEEGVDSFVPYAGKLKDNLEVTTGKIKSTMCSCGVTTIAELQAEVQITLVSSTSIIEGGAHDVMVKDTKN